MPFASIVAIVAAVYASETQVSISLTFILVRISIRFVSFAVTRQCKGRAMAICHGICGYPYCKLSAALAKGSCVPDHSKKWYLAVSRNPPQFNDAKSFVDFIS